MRKIILAFVLLFAMVGTIPAQDAVNVPHIVPQEEVREKLPNAYMNYGAAFAAARRLNKRMFVMLTSANCEPCNITKHNVLYKKEIWEPLNQYFIVHFVDVDLEVETARLFAKHRLYDGKVPTMFFFDKGAYNITGKYVGGFRSPEDFNDWYKFVHNLK